MWHLKWPNIYTQISEVVLLHRENPVLLHKSRKIGQWHAETLIHNIERAHYWNDAALRALITLWFAGLKPFYYFKINILRIWYDDWQNVTVKHGCKHLFWGCKWFGFQLRIKWHGYTLNVYYKNLLNQNKLLFYTNNIWIYRSVLNHAVPAAFTVVFKLAHRQDVFF